MYSTSLLIVVLCVTYTVASEIEDDFELGLIDAGGFRENSVINRPYAIQNLINQNARSSSYYRGKGPRNDLQKKRLAKLSSVLDRSEPTGGASKLYTAQVYVKLIQKLLHHYADNTGQTSKVIPSSQKRTLGGVAGLIDDIEDTDYKDNESIGRAVDMLYNKLRAIKGNKPVFTPE